MKQVIMNLIDDDLEAWRICRAWKQILGVYLDENRVAGYLRQLKGTSGDPANPTPLVDKILSEIKEPGGNRARRGAHNEARKGSVIILAGG